MEHESVVTSPDLVHRWLNLFTLGGYVGQESEGNRPRWEAAGGPGGRPCVHTTTINPESRYLADLTTEWLPADTSFRVWWVARESMAVADRAFLQVRPCVTYNRAGGLLAWRDGGSDDEATVAAAADTWAAYEAYYDDGEAEVGIRRNNGVVSSVATSPPTSAAVNQISVGTLGSAPAFGKDARISLLVVASGVRDDEQSAAMGQYINARFGAEDLPVLLWGDGLLRVPGAAGRGGGTQGAHVKRWAIPFPSDGLPPLGIVDGTPGTDELIVDDTDGDFIVEGL